jgi:hypothetical protein
MDEQKTPDAPPATPDWGNVRFDRSTAERTKRSERFSAAGFGGVVAVLAAFLVGLIMYRTADHGTEPLAQALGGGIGAFLIAYVIGWIAFRVGGREPIAGQIGMVCGALLALGGQVVPLAERGNQMHEITAINEAIRASNNGFEAIVARPIEPAAIPALTAGQLGAFDALVRRPEYDDGDPRQRVDAVRAIVQRRVEVQLVYLAALQAISRELAPGVAMARDPAKVEALHAASATFEQAGQTYLADMRGMTPFVQARLDSAPFNGAYKKGMLMGLEQAMVRDFGTLEEFVAANGDSVKRQVAYVDLLGRNTRVWRTDAEGNVLVDDQALLDELQAQERGLANADARVQLAIANVEAMQKRFNSKQPTP